MTRFNYIKQYEQESGNTVLNNDRIVDSMGKDIGKFTISIAQNYHQIIQMPTPE